MAVRAGLTEGGDQQVAVQYALVAVLRFFHRDEEGQGLAEYALILALIAIVAIVALIFLSSQINDKLSIIGSTIDDAAP